MKERKSVKEQEDKDESDFLRYAVFYYFLAKTNVYNLFKILFYFFWFFTIKSIRGYFRNLFWAAVVVRVHLFHWRYFCEYITQHCHVSVNTRSMGMVRSKFSYN